MRKKNRQAATNAKRKSLTPLKGFMEPEEFIQKIKDDIRLYQRQIAQKRQTGRTTRMLVEASKHKHSLIICGSFKEINSMTELLKKHCEMQRFHFSSSCAFLKNGNTIRFGTPLTSRTASMGNKYDFERCDHHFLEGIISKVAEVLKSRPAAVV